MTDKVQKIRKEVKKLHGNPYYMMAVKDALAIIDSLQEEPIFKVGDTIQKKDNNSIRYSIINKTSDGYRALRGLSDTIVIWFSEQDQWELVEEPVSRTPSDVESAMQEVEEKSRAFTEAHYGENADTVLAQMRGEEPISKNLEEAAEEWNESLYRSDAFKAGAKWQGEQIIEALLSEVLPCFMHGGEADEVVAKLEEVLNKKK